MLTSTPRKYHTLDGTDPGHGVVVPLGSSPVPLMLLQLMLRTAVAVLVVVVVVVPLPVVEVVIVVVVVVLADAVAAAVTVRVRVTITAPRHQHARLHLHQEDGPDTIIINDGHQLDPPASPPFFSSFLLGAVFFPSGRLPLTHSCNADQFSRQGSLVSITTFTIFT